ncbi:uncharacterized protein LOC130664214 [Microplitis mediator]|uniref:uncharacterized protein LOC130664214 n=1 Tax=Microplitis mediator TaxID=375433 RepID=UPI0025541161|nr:uncharacterized protein LOC130664214 [Microplitis mediator]
MTKDLYHLSIEQDKIIEIQKQITDPIQWPAPKFSQILDLKSHHYDDVLRLIKHHFFPNDPMCKAINLIRDNVSINNYLELIRVWMKDTMSLVAISSKSERVIGTAIMRIDSLFDKTNTHSRMQIFEGEALKKIMNLTNTLVKQVDAYTQLD